MIFNIFRVLFASGFFIIVGIIFRGSIVTDHQIQDAKDHLGINQKQHIYTLDATEEHNARAGIFQGLLSAPTIAFHYHPESLELSAQDFVADISQIVYSPIIQPKLSPIHIELHQAKNDVRGQMKAGAVKLYNITQADSDEMIGVFVHELAHHIDLYSLVRKVLQDPSNSFYSISWDDTTTISSGEKIKDFVSGYAMSNKYEDFAESFTYYVFANEEMREKTKDSFSLKQKYEFFEQNIFKASEFKQTDFSLESEKRYYWDITKKLFDIEKFLEYMEKQV